MEELREKLSGLLIARGRRRWRTRFMCTVAILVVFVTAYTMVMPALTLDENTVETAAGISLDEGKSEKKAETKKSKKKSKKKSSKKKSEKKEETEDDSAIKPAADKVKAKIGGAELTISYSKKAGLPEDVSVVVTEYSPNSDDKDNRAAYDAYFAMAQKKALDKGADEVTFARFFALQFFAGDQELVPEEGVKISVKYDKSLKLADDETYKAVQFGKDSAKLLKTTTKGDRKLTKASFTLKKFPGLGLIVTRKDAETKAAETEAAKVNEEAKEAAADVQEAEVVTQAPEKAEPEIITEAPEEDAEPAAKEIVTQAPEEEEKADQADQANAEPAKEATVETADITEAAIAMAGIAADVTAAEEAQAEVAAEEAGAEPEEGAANEDADAEDSEDKQAAEEADAEEADAEEPEDGLTSEVISDAEEADEDEAADADNTTEEADGSEAAAAEDATDESATEEAASDEDAAADESALEKTTAGEAADESAIAETTAEETAVETTAEETTMEESSAEETTEEAVEEEVYEAGELTCDGDGYKVVLNYSAEAKIPADATLSVRELQEGSAEYEAYRAQAEAAVAADPEKAITFARAFDIKIQAPVEVPVETEAAAEAEAGEADAEEAAETQAMMTETVIREIQPAVPVSVQILLDEAVEVAPEDEVKALHVEANDGTAGISASDPEVTAVNEVAFDAAAEGEEPAEVKEVEFKADGFSVWMIVGSGTITAEFLSHNGTKYEVTVTYGPEAEIPDGSSLEVIEFEPDSDAYKKAQKLLFSTADSETGDEASEPELELVDDSGEVPLYTYTTPTSIIREIASDRCLDVLDISIKDADGHEVEPKSRVQVSIRMKKAPEGIDAQTVADTAVVQHLDESSGELVIETVASADESVDGTVLVANEGVEASFEVDSFSKYTFTYGNGSNRRSVNVHYVDESGTELAAPNPVPSQNNGHSHLVYDIEGYDFLKTTINSANGTQISPYIQFLNFGQWHSSWGGWYQDEDYHWGYRTLTVSGDTRSLGNWTALNNNQDVYVVYRKKTTPPQGGESVPVVPQGEWPEFPSGDNTKPTKTSVENGDGTNTLSLTVTGAETPLTSGKVKAQVIVVFDISGSMNYRMGSDTDPGYGERSRLSYSKEAVESLANALGTNDKLDVEMALVTFSNYARTAKGFTNVSNAQDRQSFINTVNGLSATGGTNWEAALREANYIQTKSDAKTYVIFVSDGAPTFRISRGSITESNIAGNVDDGDAYYMSYGIYGSGGATHDEDRSFALAQATSIVNSNKTFYTVALTDANDTTHASEYMGDLNSRAGGAGNYSATSPEELSNVINAIGTSITTELGFADIEIHDGITDLTNLNAKVLQSVDENSFKYYRYGGENNKYGTESNPTTWENDPSDPSKLEGGANKATYDSNTGAVEWNMGSGFQLEDGVTYKVSFKVWPDQDAYDWIAKLRNGTIQYANLPADVKPQIDEATLSLKTNTDAYVRYKKSSTTSGDTTTTGNPIQVDYNPVKPMPLPAQSIPIEKIFINELDPERYENEPVRISLTGDGDTFAVVNLNDSNNFKTSAFISYGLMTPGDEPVLKEPGHDFVLTELSAYHWDLEAGVYRPMIIGGVRKLLQKVDSGGDYTIDGKQYKELADGASISAKNYRRSNLNLTKNIVDKDGQTSINDKYPNQLFEYTITVNSADGEDVWFSVQTDPDDYTTVVTDLTTSAYPELDDGGNPKNNGYFYQHSGNSFTVSLKPTWNLRFTNLPKGSTYTIVESSAEGFEFNRASLNPAGDDEQFTITESTATVTGVVAEYSKQYQITYTNRSTMLDIVVIKTDDAGTSIPGATFNLLKKDGSSYHAIPNRDDLANFSIPVNGITLTGLLPGDYELEEVTPPDGYIIIKKETYFNLSDSDEVIKLSDESKDIASTSGEKKNTVSIKNQPGQALPNTGGPGTLPYTLCGIALIMASALMYGFRMRRRERRYK